MGAYRLTEQWFDVAVADSRPMLGSRRATVSAAGLLGALTIQTLLILPFVLDLSLPSPCRPNTTGAGSTAYVSAAEPEMTVVFIDEPTPAETPAETPPKPPALASRGIASPDLQLVVLSPDPLPAAAANAKADESDDPQAAIQEANAAEHAKLYGRYVGQVQARIERAWMRPRTEIGAPQFSCRVRIQQGRRGAVVSADLDHCNGTERWQQSLLSAVRTASPLPAPPDASVYADVLWLSFTSGAFEEGGSTQGFEPETRLAATDRSAMESFRQFASGDQGGDDKESVIHLTIIGSSAGTTPQAPGEPPAELSSSDPPPQ
jgi:hypothetical protein